MTTKHDDRSSKSTKNGRGHILQDLLSSRVRLNRSNVVPPPPTRSRQDPHNSPLKNNSSPELRSSCSICSESTTDMAPLAVQEMEILAKFVLSQEQISLVIQTEDHPPIFCCKICSSAILSLAKLTTQIENIIISLRAVISSRKGLFNKLRNEPNINEFSHEIASSNQNSPTDDDQHSIGSIVDEEFFIKVEYDDDHDVTPDDPLCEPDTSESQDDCHDSHCANSNAESKYVCKICQPNVTFSTYDQLRRHMRNKNIHPDANFSPLQQPRLPKKFPCKLCNRKFARKADLYRHLSSKNIHPDADIAASSKRTKRSVTQKRDKFPCPKCEKSFSSYGNLHEHKSCSHDESDPFWRKCTLCPQVFLRFKSLQMHMHKRHNFPLPTSSRQPQRRHSCAMCLKLFATPTTGNRHVELAHFPDKTSCPYGCATKFGSEAEWVTHLEGCDSPKMSAKSECICQYCPAVFRNTLLQIEHRLRVHPEKCYSCSICEHRFTRKFVLDYHNCGKNTKTWMRKVSNSESNVEHGSNYVCKICQPNVTFTRYENCRLHMNRNVHSVISDVQAEAHLASKKFACNLCNAKFTRKWDLLRHLTNTKIHSDVSDADISAALERTRASSKSQANPESKYVNPMPGSHRMVKK